MKKRLLAILIACIPLAGWSQNVFTDFQDGKIWFQVKDDYRINAPLQEDPHHLPIGTLGFLNGISKNHQLTNLSRPFYAAKNSPILQRTFLLEFSDAANIMSVISELKATGNVVYAERVPLDHECLTPNDP
ncbi:MAG TPA: hypothetical protein VFU15_15540, partial [Bacteroidia bacterium]|nr:hypothetical protein [Bacteroidia bacterium]